MSLPELPASIHNSKFVVTTTLVADGGKTDELKKQLVKVRDQAVSSTEPGTLSYRVVQLVEAPDTLVIFAEYAGKAGVEAHGNSAVAQAFGQQVKSLVKSFDAKGVVKPLPGFPTPFLYHYEFFLIANGNTKVTICN